MAEQTAEVTETEKPSFNPTFKAVSLDELPQITREGKTAKLVEEFLAANIQAAEVEDHAKTFSASLMRYRKTHPEQAASFKYSNRAGKLYLIRTDLETEAVSEDGEVPSDGASVADLDA